MIDLLSAQAAHAHTVALCTLPAMCQEIRIRKLTFKASFEVYKSHYE